MSEPETVPEPVHTAGEKLSQPRPMRRGSLGQRWIRCGKPNCALRHPRRGSPRSLLQPHPHGGADSVATSDAQQGERARQQVAAGREFRQQVKAFREACERWADAELADAEAGTAGRWKKGLQAIFEAEIAAEVEALISPEAVEALYFQALETTVRRRALELTGRAVERRFNVDLSDHVGATTPCTCGQTARYAGRRAKHFETVLGAMRLERAYYDLSYCKKGLLPRDRTLDVEDHSLSPSVRRMGWAPSAPW